MGIEGGFSPHALKQSTTKKPATRAGFLEFGSVCDQLKSRNTSSAEMSFLWTSSSSSCVS